MMPNEELERIVARDFLGLHPGKGYVRSGPVTVVDRTLRVLRGESVIGGDGQRYDFIPGAFATDETVAAAEVAAAVAREVGRELHKALTDRDAAIEKVVDEYRAGVERVEQGLTRLADAIRQLAQRPVVVRVTLPELKATLAVPKTRKKVNRNTI